MQAMLGANPNRNISTAKIKHCYGVIAGALSIVGNSIEWRLTQALARETTAKTLSVVIRLHRDCDSRWVADSALEVINGW